MVPLSLPMFPMAFNFAPYPQQYVPVGFAPQFFCGYEFVDPRFFFPSS